MNTDTTITIRIPQEWKTELEIIAKKELRTVSGLIKKDLAEKYPQLTKKEK